MVRIGQCNVCFIELKKGDSWVEDKIILYGRVRKRRHVGCSRPSEEIKARRKEKVIDEAQEETQKMKEAIKTKEEKDDNTLLP